MLNLVIRHSFFVIRHSEVISLFMRKFVRLFLVIAAGFLLSSCQQTDINKISLEGDWGIRLDHEDIGLREGWMSVHFKDRIYLPGTTDENEYGHKTVDTAYGILSRAFEYVGPAWYTKEIEIPETWADQEVTLFLERVLWESRVFLDGKAFGIQDALGTPHIHPLGVVKPGKHLLSIRINNNMIHNIGDKGHAYGEYMQSIWNGIVGEIELQARSPRHVERIRTFPDPASNSVRVEVDLRNPYNQELKVLFLLREKNSRKLIDSVSVVTKEKTFSKELTPDTKIRTWDEFDPFLYEIELILNPETDADSKQVQFGFITVDKSDHHILVNNHRIFLRGNLDCIHFPLTGYPDMDKDGWMRIFKKYKEFGLNHVRFHSWCPPEAAFEAADETGIYIQAEASVWIDWWMGTDMVARGRPEMDTKGYPQGIGQGDEDADNFIWEEMKRVVETYGNHPSFILFCIGNELGSSDYNLMGEWIKTLKEMDPRRLYAASTARTITPWCDYSATHNVPGIGSVRQKMTDNLNWDYEKKYSQAHVPIIAHEIGQWPVYPDWDEIEKYTGPLKPRYLEKLAQLARDNGLFDHDEELRMASARLSALLYKDEVESFMRTQSCAGFQLLSMQDYIGQGEALIGWLDSFYDEKGGLDPKTARQFLNAVVPLVKLPAYCFEAGDSLVAEVLLHQYGPEDFKGKTLAWELIDTKGNTKESGRFPAVDYNKGNLHQVGNLMIQLPEQDQAEQYTLKITVEGSEYSNSWPIWLYPKEIPEANPEIIITKQLSPQVLNELYNGASVLLIANECGEQDNQKLASWRPLYWSASFFPGQSIETLGLLIDQSHPAFNDFPTENFGSWNWYRLCEGAHGFKLADFPPDFSPIIQPVSDFHYSERLGSLFETKMGKGKLLVCGYNISPDRDSVLPIRQLRYSLLNYMNSDEFNPGFELDRTHLLELLKYTKPAISEAPKGYEDALLFVEAASNQESEGSDQWTEDSDIIIQQKQVTYKVLPEGTWKDETASAWFGKKIRITLSVPNGLTGYVYLFVHDWNRLHRDGSIIIENRSFSIGKHENGKWIKLDFMREDTQDGEIIVELNCSKGPNLMVTKMALISGN